jgi:hypothetical protein
MRHQSLIKALCQKLGSASVRHIPVRRVMLKEVPLGLKGIRELLVALDVLLRSIDDTDETELKRVYASREDVHGIGSVVHEIQLGENTDCPPAHRVDMAGQLQSFRVDKINVRGRDSEDYTVRLGNVFGNEVSRLLLDVGRLIADGYLQLLAPLPPRRITSETNLGQTRQIDKRQTENMRRVDLQVDWLAVDTFVVASNSRCFGFNLALNLGEVVEPPPRNVEEFSPLLLTCYTGWGVRNMDFIVLVGVVALARDVDELEDERSSSNDAAASGEKVPADDVLDYR